jgi:mono/diheme cytochrome c family protein
MQIRKLGFVAYAFPALTVLIFASYLQGQAPNAKPASPAAATDQKALVAQGKARFQAYKCYDCHGQNGEGTQDAPDLTHSKLTAEQVSKFLQKPSVDADNKGMPDVPADSPDHKPLVAYVMSLRAGGSRPAGTASKAPSKQGSATAKPAGSVKESK